MGSILVLVLQAFSLLLVARAVMSWIPDLGRSSVGQMVYQVTEPVVGPVRRLLPRTGPIDISLMLVLLGIQVILVPLARSLP
ncbi:MAG: YggT family protein [Acidimicrobiales bacterium]